MGHDHDHGEELAFVGYGDALRPDPWDEEGVLDVPRVRWAVSEPGVKPSIYITFADGQKKAIGLREALHLAKLLVANLEHMLQGVGQVVRAAGSCAACGQIDEGQTGEYPCKVCGLPLVWDCSLNLEEVGS